MLIDAKRDVEKEIEALKALKEQYSGNIIQIKPVDEGEMDDTENGQDSVSEDDSDDDSDRKGTQNVLLFTVFFYTLLARM